MGNRDPGKNEFSHDADSESSDDSGSETESLSIGRETLVALGAKVLNAALGFGGVVIFANELGDVGLGEYRTVLAAAFVLTQVPGGTATAVKKRVSEVDTDVPQYLGAGLLVHLVFSVLVTLGFLVLQDPAVEYFGTIELAGGVVLVVLSLGLFNITNRFYAGIGYPALSSWVDSARSVLTVGFQIAFLLLGMQAFGLIIGFFVGTVLSAVLSVAVAGQLPTRPTRRVFERIYDFVRWVIPSAFVSNAYSSADVLLIRWLVGPGPVGVYTVANQLAQPAVLFSSSITDALDVKASGRDSAGLGVRSDLKNSLSYAGLIAIPMVFGALAIPNALMTTLFGPEFSDAPGLALVGLTLFQLFKVYGSTLGTVTRATDRPRLSFRVGLGVLVLHLPLAVALGHYFGLLGVIASTVVAEIVRFCIYQVVSHRLFGGVVVTRPMFDQMLAGTIMFSVVEFITWNLVSINSWIWLAVVVGIGAATYFIALLGVSRHFRETLGHVLPWVPSLPARR
jgi:O-antigen/teichoic acid export membrane protein